MWLHQARHICRPVAIRDELIGSSQLCWRISFLGPWRLFVCESLSVSIFSLLSECHHPDSSDS